MSFYRNYSSLFLKLCRHSLVLLFYSFFIAEAFAQVVIPDEERGNRARTAERAIQNTTYISQSYTSEYSDIPRFIVTSTKWYSAPKDITLFVSLSTLNTLVKYQTDDTSYLELTKKNNERGRMFLKVMEGQLYSVYDLFFVPYTYNDEEEVVVPLSNEEGMSFLVEVVHKDVSGANKKRVRYIERKQEFVETYKYTNKGALRSLVRNYEDGSIDKFLYFFTTSGLEEVFHQDIDGRSFVQKYTPEGALEKEEEIDGEGNTIQSLQYFFNTEGDLVKQEQYNFITKNKEVRTYVNGNIRQNQVFLLEEGGETLISEKKYNYNRRGNQTENKEANDIGENDEEFIYDEEGNLLKKREFTNKILTKEIEYTEGKNRIETLYFGGEARIKIHYEGSNKIKEEVISNAKVIEIR